MRSIRLLFLLAVAVLVLVQPCTAQGHSAVLTWQAPADVIAGSTYSVYRAAAACPVSGTSGVTWTKLNSAPITALTYTDSTIGVGTWCYYVTQVQSTTESTPSVTAGGTAKPDTVTIIVTIN